MKLLKKYSAIISLGILISSFMTAPISALSASQSEDRIESTSSSLDNNQEKLETKSSTTVSSEAVISEQKQPSDETLSETNEKASTQNSEIGSSSDIDSSERQTRAPNENIEKIETIDGTKATDLIFLRENVDLSINSPTATSVYTGNVITSTIQYSTSGQSPFVIKNPYIEVVFPSLLLPSSSTLETEAFLDRIQIVDITDERYLKTTIEEKNGNTVYKIYFTELDSSTKMNIPYSFSFSNRVTPASYSITPTVALYTENGEEVAFVTDKTYSPKYDKRSITKSVYGTGSSEYGRDGQILAAGMANSNNTDYVSGNGYEYIPFYFELNATNDSNSRLIKTAKITDSLPTYIDINGNKRTAFFDAKANPGWVDNGDGTVTYSVTQTPKEIGGDLRHDIREKVNYITLNLAFPNAPAKENGEAVNYNNSVDIELIPYNATEEEIVTITDSIKFKIAAEPFLGSGMLGKDPKGSVIHDNMGLYSERVRYYVKLNNKLSSPLKNIVFSEDANEFDPRLYVASISPIYYRGSKTLTVPFSIKGIRADGSSEVITPQSTGLTQLNANTQAEMNSIANDVQTGRTSIEEVDAINPEFVKYEFIIDPSIEILPGDRLDFDIYMAFKDPYHVSYSKKTDIKNSISSNFNYNVANGQERTLQVKDDANTRFTPLHESISLSKSTEPANTTFKVGDRVQFRLTADLRNLSNARYLDNPTFVDILPKGLSFDNTSRISGFYNTSSLIESYTFEKNYKNSGHDAALIKFKSGMVSELEGGDANVRKTLNIFVSNLIVNKDVIPTKAETENDNNDNQLYFYFGNEVLDEIESNQIVADIYDLYKGNDIYRTSSKVPAITADSISIDKQIRNKGDEWRTEIDTDFDEIFDYRLRIKNYIPKKQSALTVYDRLPFADGNGSSFSNVLNKPVEVLSGDNNVTSKFDIYYRNDNAPTNPRDAENSSAWTTSFMEDTTAIKVVLKSGETIGEYETLNIQVEAKAPSHQPRLYDTSTINSFNVKYEGTSYYVKSNEVKNNLPNLPKIEITGTKTWEDQNNQDGLRPDEITVNLLANGEKVASKTVTEADDWKYSFT
ncbi:Cna B-type domain-containing protein, partial [Enterococcus faecalis]|uniref:Cna B-type domain-containing protein n=1 Tax=Enterococcus faecalis TaxID=1351 RepID=UPI001E333A34